MKNEFYLAAWMANEISDEELKDLVSSEDFIVYSKIKQATASIEKPTVDVAAKYADFLNKIDTNKQSKVRQLFPKWAYAVAAAVVLFFGITQFSGGENTSTTSFGEQQIIVLNDGSSVKLNAKSKIQYKKDWEFDRNVFLQGEAYFKITKGDKFDVETKQGVISVLGTEFNVVARENYFEVICYEGKVAVQYNDSNTLLTKGKALRVIAGQEIKEWDTNEETASWKTGVSKFNSIPVKYLFKAIENEFHITINAESIDENRLFTGSFEHNNVDAAITSICMLLDVEYSFNKERNVVSLSNK